MCDGPPFRKGSGKKGGKGLQAKGFQLLFLVVDVNLVMMELGGMLVSKQKGSV